MPQQLEQHYVALIDSICDIAIAQYFDGSIDDAIEFVSSQTEILASHQTSLGSRAKLQFTLGKLLAHRAFLIGGKLDETSAALDRAIEMAESSDSKNILGLALSYRAFAIYTDIFHNNIGKYEDAKPDFERAIVLQREINHTAGLSHSLVYQGIIFERLEDLDSAKSNYEEAAKIAREHGHELEESYAVRHLAFLKQNEGDFDGALEFFERSLELREKVGFKTGLAISHFAIGYLQLARKDYEASMEQTCKAQAYAEEFELTRVKTLCLYVLGEIHIGLEDPGKAKEFLEESKILSEEIGYPVGVTRAEEKLAELK